MPPIVLGALCLVACVLLPAALGYRVLKLWGFEAEGPVALGMLSLGLGLGMMQFIPFALLTAHIGTPGVIRTSVAIVALLLIPDMIRIVRASWEEIRRPLKLQWWEWTLVAILVSLLAAIFLRSVMPALDTDVLSYHLTAPLRFFEAGQFLHLLTITPTNWPMSLEFLYGILITFNPEAPVAVVPFVFGLVTIVLVYVHALRIGSRMSAAVAFVLLLAQSTFWWEMSTGMIDIGAACFALLSLLVLGKRGEDRGGRREILLAAVFAGFAATTKLQGIWVIAAMMIVLFLREREYGTLPSLKETLLFGLIAGLIVTPWYVKTWIVTGNPFYPLFYDVFGGNELSASGSSRYVHLYKLIDAFHALPSWLPLTPTNISLHHLIRACLAAIVAIFVVRSSRRFPNASLLSFAGILTVFICAGSSFHMRFMLPAYTTFIAGISFVSRGWTGWFAFPLCLTAVIMTLWISETRLRPDIALTWRVATGDVGRDEYIRIRGLRDFGVVEFANRSLPEGSRILLGTDNENTAMLRHKSYWANYWLQDSFHYDSLQHLLSDIRRIGITHLMLVQTFPPWYASHIAWGRRVDVEHPVLMELAGRFGTELFSEKGVSLFELNLPVDPRVAGE